MPATIKQTILSALMMTAVVSANNMPSLQQDQDWSPNGVNVTLMRYYVTAVRGSLQGFQQGILNNKTFSLNPQCLDETFIGSFIKIEDAVSAFDIGRLFGSMGDIYQIGYNLDKSCNFNELFYMLGQYCYKTNCNFDDIQKNLLSNLFTLTGSINNIADLMFSNGKTQDLTDLSTCFTTFNGVGSDVGKIFRAILKFDPTKVSIL
eukprot:403361995